MKCRICKCTEAEACAGGCDWAERELCTTCAEARMHLAWYIESAHTVSTESTAKLMIEAAEIARAMKAGQQ